MHKQIAFDTTMISLPISRATIASDPRTTDALGLHLSPTAEESSHFIAGILIKCVYWFLDLFDLEHHSNLFLILYSALVFLVAWAAGIMLKWIMVYTLNKIGPHVKSDFYRYLADHHFFTKICRIIPPIIFLILIQFTFTGRESLASWLSRLTWIYVVFVLCRTFTTLADVIWTHIDSRANKRRLPLNGVVQLIKLIMWIIGVIVAFGILFNRSPGSMLAGLGAFSAVLMLIFKDNILGVVAGVQLAENDSLHEGDWIVPNGSDANGTVVEVGLTAIKIENWDKTISTIPPYSLISNGFRNYRNMQQSRTRRIQRCYMIDADSVIATDDAMLAEFAEIPMLKEWIRKKIEQRDAGKTEDVSNSAGLADGSLDTNLGILRAYVKIYLDNNPDISHADDCFVNTLEQTSGGIPLQVYCFTSTSSWIPYEGIQSTVFEHIAVMLYRFHLYTFENPSGRDTIVDGYLSSGKDPEFIRGIPYPFTDSGTPGKPDMPPRGMQKS